MDGTLLDNTKAMKAKKEYFSTSDVLQIFRQVDEHNLFIYIHVIYIYILLRSFLTDDLVVFFHSLYHYSCFTFMLSDPIFIMLLMLRTWV